MKNIITKEDLLDGYRIIRILIDLYIDDHGIDYIIAEDAPQTFTQMKAMKEKHGKFIVYNGGDHGHLGKEYNIKFRAMHDFMHLKHGLTFKYTDEKKLSELTAEVLSDMSWNFGFSAWDGYLVRKIIKAEIGGQIEYYEKHKEYVKDQSKFIEQYLEVE